MVIPLITNDSDLSKKIGLSCLLWNEWCKIPYLFTRKLKEYKPTWNFESVGLITITGQYATVISRGEPMVFSPPL